MSGLAGIWQKMGRPTQTETLHSMSEAIESYGADDMGLWAHGEVGLVHRMRRTTPESIHEQQPFSTAGDAYVLVSDARLDNRQDLLAQLGMADQVNVPDSHIILAAYQAWGEDCPAKLIGDFAFAIWDEPKQQFFCARDPFGVRPFYYYNSRELFVFGSAIRALLVVNEVPRRLNEEKIADYLLEMFEDKARTFYQDVFRLLPAHWMVISSEGIRVSRYWSLNPEFELRLKKDEDYAEAYRELFEEAVRCRLRSTVAVGSALSGGIDSSSVACVAGRLLQQEGRQLNTFSIIFDDVPESDEREYIQAVLEAGNYKAHFAQGDQVNPITDLCELIPFEEEPFYSPQLFLSREMWRTAQNQGVGVLLEGLMGDNVTSHGYAWLSELGHNWRWVTLYRQFRALAKNHPDPQPAWKYMARAFWHDGIKANLSEPILRIYEQLRGRDPDPAPALPAILNPQFACRFNLPERIRQQQMQERAVRTQRQQHYLDLEYGLIPTGMEIYAEQAARFGIEPRFPFLDRRLVEFCLAIPADQKLRDGYTRRIARVGLADYLPEKTLARTSKADLSWNFLRGLKADGALLQDILDGATTEAEKYLDLSYIRSRTQRALQSSGRVNGTLYVFLSAALIAWLNHGSVSKSFSKGGKVLSSVQNEPLHSFSYSQSTNEIN